MIWTQICTLFQKKCTSSRKIDSFGTVFRWSHLLVDLGWVDFDFCFPSSCSAASAKFPSAQTELGRQWNTLNSSRPSPVHGQMGTPCGVLRFLLPYTLSPKKAVVESGPGPFSFPFWHLIDGRPFNPDVGPLHSKSAKNEKFLSTRNRRGEHISYTSKSRVTIGGHYCFLDKYTC